MRTLRAPRSSGPSTGTHRYEGVEGRAGCGGGFDALDAARRNAMDAPNATIAPTVASHSPQPTDARANSLSTSEMFRFTSIKSYSNRVPVSADTMIDRGTWRAAPAAPLRRHRPTNPDDHHFRRSRSR